MSRPLHLCTAVVTAFLLGACGQSGTESDGRAEGGNGQVASLTSKAPDAGRPARTSDGRPQLRMDTSDAERDRLFDIWEDCLFAHGVKENTARSNAAGKRSLDQSGEPREAYAACSAKLPRQPPELDEATNPNYAAQWNDNVKCMRAHGMKVHMTKPGDWTYDSDDGAGVSDTEEDQIRKTCILEAFGGHAKAN